MQRLLCLAVLACVVSGSVNAGDKLSDIDEAVKAAVARSELPGAVILILHNDKIVYRKAFGHRAEKPIPTLMTEDTIFDLASLTKPIVTALCIMFLIEDGKVKIDDPIAKYLTGFVRKETEEITIAQLLTHTGGFIADNSLKDYQAGQDKAWENLFALKPIAPPGSKFIYSDVGFILLGKIVERAAGMPLDAFAKKRIFDPLGMNDTGFRPQGDLKKRCAPTQEREERWMIGEVHDPRAYLLGGVAGHAGLFSSAGDLAIFARMMLNEGKHQGKPFLRPDTLKLMTAPRKAPEKKSPGLRTYGWDMATSYSSNRGSVFPEGVSYGHTGFTRTSIWLDPRSRTAVIILSNRVHPDGKGQVGKLRNRVATIAGTVLAGSD
jgi:CubicO group peptidase (beta-lactamase class C family)